MITPVEIRKLTLTMEGGTIVRWLKQEGEQVNQDEALFEMETDKVLVEVVSPTSGLLRKIITREGPVAVGATVAFIGGATDEIPGAADFSPEKAAVSGPSRKPAAQERTDQEPGSVRATPAARRRAKELGVRLETVRGTGPEGRITQEDVEKAGGLQSGSRQIIQP